MKQNISIFACQNLLEYINCKFCPRKEGVYNMYQFVQYHMIELRTSPVEAISYDILSLRCTAPRVGN